MKKCFSIVLLTLIIHHAFAQDAATVVKGERVVKVKNWGSRALLLRKGLWEILQDTIIQQIGAYEFEKVKRFSAVERLPYALTLFRGLRPIDKDSLAALDLKLERLVTYKIATAIYRQDGKSWAKAILRVPYSENKDWDPATKWDTVYFVVPLEHVEVEKTKPAHAKQEQVIKVKDWGSRILLFRKDFWDKYKDTLVLQIGEYEYGKAKKFSYVERIPYQLTLFKGFQRTDKDSLAALNVKMQKLVSFKIATITAQRKETNSTPVQYALIQVPYPENSKWDSVAKWDSVYFVLPDSTVVTKKSR